MRSVSVAAELLDGLAESFLSAGFVVVSGLVGDDDVVEIRADAVRFARGAYPVFNPQSLAEGATDNEALATMLAVHFPHWVSDVALRVVTHPGIVEVLATITGAHLPHWDGRVKCMQSMLFTKPPGLPGQAWHQDERFIATRDRSLVGAWIALDPATVKSGCLWVIPGSHRDGRLWPTRPHGNLEEYDFADESYGFDDADAIPVEVEPGDVVFFNGYLLHRSTRNRSGHFRRALVNHYCNAWSPLPFLVPPISVNSLEIPQLNSSTTIMVNGDDPYPWQEQEPAPSAVYLRPYASGHDPAEDPHGDVRRAGGG